MKSVIRKIFLVVVVLMILFSINTKVFALSEIISDGQSFLQKADQSKADIDVAGLQDLSGYLYNILLAAGVVIAVIVATILGIQFMLGGAEGQAKVKEMLVPFVVGCVIVFGGFGFWKIAMTVGNKIDNASSGTQVTQPSGGSSENQYDFTKRACETCGEVVEPVFDLDRHTYVCPSCRNPMA